MLQAGTQDLQSSGPSPGFSTQLKKYCNAIKLNFHGLLLAHFAELVCNYKNTCVDTCMARLYLLALEEKNTTLGHQLGLLL